jgi:hypothetical protein
MSDRIDAIRARWKAATPGPWALDPSLWSHRDAAAVANAPDDIAYLLDAYRHMVESWQTLEEMADDIGPLDHGAGCQSHFGKPCDCAWAEFRQVLAPVAPDAEPKCTGVWGTCEKHGGKPC